MQLQKVKLLLCEYFNALWSKPLASHGFVVVEFITRLLLAFSSERVIELHMKILCLISDELEHFITFSGLFSSPVSSK